MSAPKYRLQFFGFDGTSDFGRGDLVAEFELAKNFGYSEYANDIGEAFATINQDDPKITSAVRHVIRDSAHMCFLRDSEEVWAGWAGETDENETDAIIYGYGYASGFYKLHTDWGTEWTSKQVDAIVNDAWTRANSTLSNSRMGWMTKGTVEAPVTTSGGSTAITLPFYRADYKRILFLLQEMAAFAISDTTNTVLFEVTPAGVFNFWKNRGRANTDLRVEWGDDKLIGFSRARLPVNRRNTIYAVGSSPRDITLRKTVDDSTDRTNKGRLEEALYFSWVRDATELERVAKLRLARAERDDSDLTLTFGANKIIPMRATGALHRMTDSIHVRIDRGFTNLSANYLIVGEQVLVLRGQEHVRLLVRDRL